MSNEAKIQWQSRPAGEIAAESQRLIDLLKTWPIDRPSLVLSLHRVHTRVSEMDRESSVEATTLGMMVDYIFSQVTRHISTKKREFNNKNLIQENGKWASYIKTFASFGRDEHEEKAKQEAHKNERKEASYKYKQEASLKKKNKEGLLDERSNANDDDKKGCEEEDAAAAAAKRDTCTDCLSWFDLGDPQLYRELDSLIEWTKDGLGDATTSTKKPPTPVLDRLHFCLEGTTGTLMQALTLNRFVQVCIWDALWDEQKKLELAAHKDDGGGGPRPPTNEKKKHDDDDDDDDDELISGSISAQQILAAIQTRETTLNEYLALQKISPDAYEQSRALLHLVRVHIVEKKNGVVPDSDAV